MLKYHSLCWYDWTLYLQQSLKSYFHLIIVHHTLNSTLLYHLPELWSGKIREKYLLKAVSRTEQPCCAADCRP